DYGMTEREAERCRILLLREGDTVTALAAECPHAGGPLAEGVKRAGRVICPWHKATFCARTGAILELPAWTPLPILKPAWREIGFWSRCQQKGQKQL
ncbi:MAG TPA: Rieske 2Fe-2S domain-containing protein, partial [Acidisoma sp.]|nr:Rieske 2Fe-2S domain-containing protein [Acidisoma sp.]